MSDLDLVLVLRYRKAVTYGFHVLLGALGRDKSGQVERAGKAEQRPLDDFPGFALKWDKFNAPEITRGCLYACRFCQTPFMFSARFRHGSVQNVRWHVDRMRERGLRDVR